jgi:hypothetical protein
MPSHHTFFLNQRPSRLPLDSVIMLTIEQQLSPQKQTVSQTLARLEA